MTDSGSDDEGVQVSIDLKFKTITEVYDLRVKENANIEKIKTQLSKKINQPAEKICLIFSGKILKDHETLTQHKIGNGMVIHMVIKNLGTKGGGPPQSRESTPSSASSTAAAGASASTNVAANSTVPPQQQPIGGGGGAGMGAMLNNPMVRDMLNSPFMENLMSNPQMTEMIRSMLNENPQFQNIIQNNPELGHILNNPQIMQQTMEMIRNPNMLNELMRNHDQAIRNIQGIPGGEAALHRLYQEVQEPLMNSVLGAPESGSPYAAGANNNNTAGTPATSRSPHAGVENAEALPNPWSRVVNQQQQAGGAANANAGVTGSGSAASGAAAPGGLPFTGMMNTPGMQSLMRQVLSNPGAMQSLLSPENMRHFGQMMGGMGGSPALMEQFRSGMANPQLMQAMTNPRVFNALMQMQQAMQVLREEVPQLFPNMPGAEIFQNLGGMTGLFGAAGNNNQQPGAAVAPGNMAADQQPVAGAPSAAGAPPNMPPGFAELFGQIALMNLGNNGQLPGGAGDADQRQPPEERYRPQLEQLTAMGFTDQQANIQALLASFGDLNMAIERLLGGAGGGIGGPD